MIATLREFLRMEAAGGIVLGIAAALGLLAANQNPEFYAALLHAPIGPPDLGLRTAEWWINEALMVLFFVLVGLEIKREMIEGQLSSWRKSALPILAAVGGMAVPAAIYAALTWSDAALLRGWAIPSATDIAFAVGVLALLGRGVPASLKVFLLALAIIDDLGAIVIIALFYAADLSWPMLAVAVPCVAALVALNRFGVTRLWPYAAVGLPLWLSVLNSGVHATVAGVILAVCIPLGVKDGVADTEAERRGSPLLRLEHALHPWVVFGILPLFAFANSGVSLAGLSFADLLAPVPLGIALGLFIGKQAGVFASVWACVKLGIAPMPEGARWSQVYGVAVLCGVGFTMSLFIGMLAFDPTSGRLDQVRIGVLAGSLVSAVVGYAVLRWSARAVPLSKART